MLSSTHTIHHLLVLLFCLSFVLLLLFCTLVKFLLLFSSFAVSKVENALLWCLHGRTHCCIATFLNSACTVAVVNSKIAKVWGNFVEDEYYHTATEFQETSLRPAISVVHVVRPLPVTPADNA